MLYKDDASRLVANGDIDKIYENYVLDSSYDDGEWHWPLLRIDIATGRPEAHSSQERFAQTTADPSPMSKGTNPEQPPPPESHDAHQDDASSVDSDAEDAMVLRRLEGLGHSTCISFQDVFDARRQLRRERKH